MDVLFLYVHRTASSAFTRFPGPNEGCNQGIFFSPLIQICPLFREDGESGAVPAVLYCKLEWLV